MGYHELMESFKRNYPEAIKMYESHGEIFPTFEEIWNEIPDIILDSNLELLISRNQKRGENKEIDWDGHTSHILVGA